MRAARSCCLRLHQWACQAPSGQVENFLSKMNRKWKSFTSVAWRRLFCKYNCAFAPSLILVENVQTNQELKGQCLQSCSYAVTPGFLNSYSDSVLAVLQMLWTIWALLSSFTRKKVPSAELRSEVFYWSFKRHVVQAKNSLTCQNPESYVWNYFSYGFWLSFGGKIWQVTFHEITCVSASFS